MIKNKTFRGKRGNIYHSRESFHANELPYETIMGKPGVIFAKEGTKIVNGVDTGIPCIVVGVKTKKPKNKLKKSELVPSSLSDGTITDVIETPEIFAGVAPYDDKYRPVPGGVSGIITGKTACTIGAIVKDSTDNATVALTCNHCCGLKYDPAYTDPISGNLNPEGITFLQPSPYDGGIDPDDKIGSVKRCVPIKFGGENHVDVGIVSIDYPVAGINQMFSLDNGPFTFGSKADYSIGTTTYKVGRTSGKIIDDHIISKDVAINCNYGYDVAYYTNLIEYSYSLGGDSGSSVLISSNESGIGGPYKIIGINFAGGATGFAVPIETVATELGVEAWSDGTWSPDIVVAHNTSPVIRVNNQCYSFVEHTSDSITHIVDAECDDSETCLLNLSTEGDRFWVGDAGHWADLAHWSQTSGGPGGASIPNETNDVYFNANSFTITGQMVLIPNLDPVYPNAKCKNMDWTGALHNPNFTIQSSQDTKEFRIYGSLTLITDMIFTQNNYIVFCGTGSHTITSAGQTFDVSPVKINAPGGTYTLLDDLVVSESYLLLYNGVFDANDHNVTCQCILGSGANGTVMETYMGSGTWTITSSLLGGINWAAYNTIHCETSTIKFTDTADGAVQLGEGHIYYNVWFDRGASMGDNIIGYPYITPDNTDNTFNDIKDTGIAAHTLRFANGKTQTVNTFTVSGSAGNLIKLDSKTTGTYTLTKTGGGTIIAEYLDIQHSVATPTNTWYAYSSVDNQSVATAGSGWIITDASLSQSASYSPSTSPSSSSSSSPSSSPSVSEHILSTDYWVVTFNSPSSSPSVSPSSSPSISPSTSPSVSQSSSQSLSQSSSQSQSQSRSPSSSQSVSASSSQSSSASASYSQSSSPSASPSSSPSRSPSASPSVSPSVSPSQSPSVSPSISPSTSSSLSSSTSPSVSPSASPSASPSSSPSIVKGKAPILSIEKRTLYWDIKKGKPVLTVELNKIIGLNR